MEESSQNLLEKYDYLSARESLDLPAFDCPPARIHEFIKALRDEEGYDLLCDVTAIDYFDASPRFVVVYHLFSTETSDYVRVATPCEDDSEPACPSMVDLYPAANWHEREAYDMFGIRFEGHPDLRRILMWDEYPHYPLRKEFPLAGHETELPYEDVVERTGIKAKPAPMMGGPFHAPQKSHMSDREPRADDESWTEAQEKDRDAEPSDIPRELRKD